MNSEEVRKKIFDLTSNYVFENLVDPITTVDDTPIVVFTLPTTINKVMVLSVQTLGISSDGGVIVGKKVASIRNVNGVISMINGQPLDIFPMLRTTEAGGASFSILIDGQDVKIYETGIAGKTMDWYNLIQQIERPIP